jgi:hypothetical protein
MSPTKIKIGGEDQCRVRDVSSRMILRKAGLDAIGNSMQRIEETNGRTEIQPHTGIVS